MKTFTAILVGGMVGALAALLYAPNSGEETRAKISGKALELCNNSAESVKGVVSQAKDQASQLKEQASQLKENVQDKAAELRS